jgi:hypothetical protein
MNITKSTIVLSLFMCLIGTNTQAATVTYDTALISGNTWKNTYSITNDTLGADIEEITIFFTVGLYENLIASTTPAGWDPLVIDPDPFIPDDGFYDACAAPPGDFCFTLSGIIPGATLSGFSVIFDYLGAGTPGSQSFDIVNPNTFAVLESGATTSSTSPSTVPIPPAFWLFVSGLLLIRTTKKMVRNFISTPHYVE